PCRQDVARDVRRARFDTSAVLTAIGADHLDVDDAGAGVGRGFRPRVARQRPGIDAIGDDGAAEAQVVAGNRVPDHVTLFFDRDARVSQGLFDRVDADVYRAGRFR